MLDQQLIFQPVFLLVALTLAMYAKLVRARMQAVKNKQVSAKYFRVLEGKAPPEAVVAIDRNVINLFELPILFYVGVAVAYMTQNVDMWTLGLAWAFAISRCVHSAVHTGGNHVMRRLQVFFLGYAVLILLWLTLAIRLLVLT